MTDSAIGQLRVLDLSGAAMDGEALLPFAIEEIECADVAAGKSALLHLWRHRKAIVLGLRDRKLPYAVPAMEMFAREGWSTAVRSSGGAIVPLDSGVVNVSLVLPNRPGFVNIHEDFAAMAKLIGDAVALLVDHVPIKSGEIAGAYCPGEYDLAIDGYKFCGIAQRRKVGAFVVQAFVVVEGRGADRAKVAAEFYRLAAQESRNSGLKVTEQSTRSLQELIGEFVTVDRFVEAIRAVASDGTIPAKPDVDYSRYERHRLERTIDSMKKRYDTN